MYRDDNTGAALTISEVKDTSINFVRNPLYHARSIPLYQPSAADITMPSPYDGSLVNLSAIAYYGSLGMPIKSICPILNIPHSWFRPQESPYRKAFHAGQSLYELTLRSTIMEAAQKDANLSLRMLSRLHGTTYTDADQSLTAEQQKQKFGRIIFGD